MLSTKDLVFKKRPAKKLTERYVKPYKIEKVVSKNAVKLKLPGLMRIHPVVNINRVVKYRKLVKEQRVEEPKLVEVEGVEEWEVEKILNKRKIRRVEKYLVHQKRFTAENDIQKKKEDLENVKELVDEFEERIDVEVRQQEGIEKRQKIKLNPNAEEFRRSELLEKYTVKLLFGWDNKRFEDEYLKKLERGWQK